MPETKYYVVTETRRIRVWANDEVSAAKVAANHFYPDAPGYIVVGEALGLIEFVETTVKKEQ